MALLFGIEEVLAFVRPLCNPEIVYFIIILKLKYINRDVFTPFLISNAHFGGQKNKKKCKINSRNFTYDSLTFSSSVFILEEVKDKI